MDDYELLGVTKYASNDDIKNAFRQKIKEYHPDITKIQNHKDKLLQIINAYKVLSKTHGNKKQTAHKTNNALIKQNDYNTITKENMICSNYFSSLSSSTKPCTRNEYDIKITLAKSQLENNISLSIPIPLKKNNLDTKNVQIFITKDKLIQNKPFYAELNTKSLEKIFIIDYIKILILPLPK